MKQIFKEMKETLGKEKVFYYLLVAILSFHGTFLALHFLGATPRIVKLPWMEETQALETRMEENFNAMLQERKEFPPLLKIGILAFAAGIIFGLCLIGIDIWKWMRGKDPVPRLGGTLQITWGFGEILKLVILFLGAAILITILIPLAHFFFLRQIGPSLFLIQTFLLELAAVGFMFLMVRRSGAEFKDLTGIEFWPASAEKIKFWLREIWLGIRTYFVILPFFIFLLAVLVVIANVLSYHPPPHPLVQVFLKEEEFPRQVVFYSLVLAFFVGPVVEEIFFRGFLYPAFRNHWGAPVSMAVTAGLFALVHENWFSMAPIFVLGIALTYLYEKRNNLLPCISLHICHNTVFIGYFFLMKRLLLY